MKKYQGYLFLIAIHDKSRRLIGRIRVDYTSKLHFPFSGFYNFPLVCHDTNSPALYSADTTNDGFAILNLIFFKI